MFEMFNAFIQNPMMFATKTKFDIPQNLQSPDDIINHLLQTRQITQDQYNTVYSRFKDMERCGQLPRQ